MQTITAEELLKFQDDYDFEFVFGEKDYGNTPPIGFTRAEIQELYLVEYGENDGAEWRAIGLLIDGRYFRATGGCDYTGWDCQAGNNGETWDSYEAFVAGLGDDDRSKLGLGIDGLGSSHVTAGPWECPSCYCTNAAVLAKCEVCGVAQGTKGAYSPGYRQCLELAGVDVRDFRKFGSYQGDWWAIGVVGNRLRLFRGFYGSCGGCDRLADRFVTEDEMYRYGQEYIESSMTLAEAEDRIGPDREWDLEADSMVEWLREVWNREVENE